MAAAVRREWLLDRSEVDAAHRRNAEAVRLRLDDDRKLNIFFADCEEPCARVCVSLSLVASTSADVVCVVCVLNVQLLSAWCKRWA